MSVQYHDFGIVPIPDKTLGSPSELVAFFRQFDEPMAGELTHPNGFMLTICTDGELATVQFSNTDGEPPYLVALSPLQIVEGSHIFIVTTSDTEIDSKHCLSRTVFEDIACYFLETGERSPAVAWEEV